jgi:hypothetical protein
LLPSRKVTVPTVVADPLVALTVAVKVTGEQM